MDNGGEEAGRAKVTVDEPEELIHGQIGQKYEYDEDRESQNTTGEYPTSRTLDPPTNGHTNTRDAPNNSHMSSTTPNMRQIGLIDPSSNESRQTGNTPLSCPIITTSIALARVSTPYAQ
jgi:hypothetical protein